MINVSTIRLLLFSLVFSVLTSLHAEDTGTFRLPKLDGAYVHYCLSLKQNCGRPAADKFCQLKGFHKTTAYKRFVKAGHTRVLGTGKVCSGPKCDGFQFIRCVPKGFVYTNPLSPRKPTTQAAPGTSSPGKRVKTAVSTSRFELPAVNAVPLDWCQSRNTNCGLSVADKFCRGKGYRYAQSYQMRDKVTRTVNLRGQQVCRGAQCKSFHYIVCQR